MQGGRGISPVPDHTDYAEQLEYVILPAVTDALNSFCVVFLTPSLGW